MRRRWIQMGILMCVIAAGAFAFWSSAAKDSEEVKKGAKAPDFKLASLDGKTYELSDFKGSGLVLNFWGTFCPPCVREMPALEKQSKVWKDKQVQIVGINLNESPITVRSFLQQYNISFPILMDRDEIRKKYKVSSYPTTFYIDANGIIQDIFVGEMTERDIQTRIEKIVKADKN
ncbi:MULTISPECIES: thiol-disulfide oxidoreductase ResA [Paenibacillus]|uniref:thiol-disulfide oxidoreductase ResA n=1 Tax=Paenibacillus TaxID=44249 RepID=UPI001575F495|nr:MULTISPECIES: thiol-disulfide oxidoreductase ResA [Paenibacillus]